MAHRNFQVLLTSVRADGETTMNESTLLQSLGQVSTGDAAEIFRDHLRGCVRDVLRSDGRGSDRAMRAETGTQRR